MHLVNNGVESERGSQEGARSLCPNVLRSIYTNVLENYLRLASLQFVAGSALACILYVVTALKILHMIIIHYSLYQVNPYFVSNSRCQT